MANVVNKVTGRYLKSVHTPDYEGNTDYIVNPSQAEIDQYLYTSPAPTEAELAKHEWDVVDLDKIDLFLDHIANGTPLPQEAIDYINHRKQLKDKFKDK
jgi:hypothetical protein